MASGVFDRPLPNPGDERGLLSLGELKSVTFEVPASTTRNLTFSKELKDGLLVMGAGTVTKRGLYIYGSTSTGNISVTAILAPTQSGMSISVSGNDIVITNGSQALFVSAIPFKGNLPTLTTPT